MATKTVSVKVHPFYILGLNPMERRAALIGVDELTDEEVEAKLREDARAGVMYDIRERGASQ